MIFVYDAEIFPEKNNVILYLLILFFPVFIVVFLQLLRRIYSQQIYFLKKINQINRKLLYYNFIYILWSILFLFAFVIQVFGYVAEKITNTEYITITYEIAFFVIGIMGELVLKYGKKLRNKIV